MKPLVTVLMTTYNNANWLRQAMDSIINQSYRNLQIIIVDDGSTDETVSIIKSYTDQRIELYECEHRGISKSLNYALPIIKGSITARIDADDIIEPERIEKQIYFLNSEPGFGIAGTWFRLIDQQGNISGEVKNPVSNDIISDEMLRRCCVWVGSSVIRTELLHSLNGFDENLKTGEDWDFFIRCIGKTKFYNIPEFLNYKRVHDSNVSSSPEAAITTEQILLKFNNKLIESSLSQKQKARAYYNIGHHYYYKNEFKKARPYFASALKLDKFNPGYIRYFISNKHLSWVIRFSRKYKLYKLWDSLRTLDRKKTFFRSRF